MRLHSKRLNNALKVFLTRLKNYITAEIYTLFEESLTMLNKRLNSMDLLNAREPVRFLFQVHGYAKSDILVAPVIENELFNLTEENIPSAIINNGRNFPARYYIARPEFENTTDNIILLYRFCNLPIVKEQAKIVTVHFKRELKELKVIYDQTKTNTCETNSNIFICSYKTGICYELHGSGRVTVEIDGVKYTPDTLDTVLTSAPEITKLIVRDLAIFLQLTSNTLDNVNTTNSKGLTI